MEPADSIRKYGYRRWYERQLIESHLYFVSCFLGIILVAVAFEEFTVLAPPMKTLVALGMGAAGMLLTMVAWVRYHRLMRRSERIADGATCRGCSSYGTFRVLETGARSASPYPGQQDEPADAEDAWLRVRCKKCGHEWKI